MFLTKTIFIDELRIPDEELKGQDNLASLFFFLQRCNLLESEDELRRLERILRHPGFRELARTFAEWICHAAYEAGITETVERLDNMREVNAMLLENAPNWKYEYMAIGREEGREEEKETALAGLRKMLRSMIQKRFGSVTNMTDEKLAAINDPDDFYSLAENFYFFETPAMLNKMMDEIISRD